MEPKLIDYYNEIPSCFKTIEKLNKEFNEVQEYNTFLKDKLKMYIKPTVLYNNIEEWNYNLSNAKLLLETELNEIIIDNNEYIEIYNSINLPLSINKLIKDVINILIKNNNLPWLDYITCNIVTSIKGLINSMKSYPITSFFYPEYLSEIIYKHIEYMIEFYIYDIPRFINT